jgi:hypothetical protein
MKTKNMQCELCPRKKEHHLNRWCPSCREMIIGVKNWMRRLRLVEPHFN